MDDVKKEGIDSGFGMMTIEEIEIIEGAKKEISHFVDQVQEALNLEETEAQQIMKEALYRHQNLIIQVIQNNEMKVEHLLNMVYIPFYELLLRGKIKDVVSTATDEQELRERLKPLHKELQTFIENKFRSFQKIPKPVDSFRKLEKQRFKMLLLELTKIIRQGGSSEIIQDVNAVSTAEEANQKVEGLVHELNLTQKHEFQATDTRGVSVVENISFPEASQERIIRTLTPYVRKECAETLVKLIKEGSTNKKVIFTGSLIQLGKLFKEIHSIILTHTIPKSRLNEWLVQHFSIQQNNNSGFKAISRSSMKAYLSEEDRITKNEIEFLK